MDGQPFEIAFADERDEIVARHRRVQHVELDFDRAFVGFKKHVRRHSGIHQRRRVIAHRPSGRRRSDGMRGLNRRLERFQQLRGTHAHGPVFIAERRLERWSGCLRAILRERRQSRRTRRIRRIVFGARERRNERQHGSDTACQRVDEREVGVPVRLDEHDDVERLEQRGRERVRPHGRAGAPPDDGERRCERDGDDERRRSGGPHVPRTGEEEVPCGVQHGGTQRER